MRNIKFSLIAVLAMGTISNMPLYSAETLQDSLVNGKFSGEFRFLYAGGTNSKIAATNPVNNSNVGSGAIELNYISAPFYGFELGIGFESGHDFGFHDYDGSSEDDARNSVSATHLHNFFLKYTYSKSSLIVGRQTIKLPLLMNSGAFPIEDYFEAATFVTKDIPDTLLNVAVVSKWYKRYGSDATSSVVQQDIHYDDPLYSIYIKNNSIPNLTLDGQYLSTNEETNDGDAPILVSGGFDQYYVRGDYKLPTALPMTFGIMYGGADFDNTGEEDASFYGVKLGLALEKVKFDLAYTSVDDDHDYPSTLGHVPDAVLYTAMLTNQAITAGTDTISLQADIDFGVKGLKTIAKVAHFEQSDTGMANSAIRLDESDEVNLDIKYSFDGVLKGFSTRLYMGYSDYDVDGVSDDFTYARLYLSYKF
ncbi:porin [Halarcobacter ebronensis]|uniref:Porin n=1 Tax=Halarcobacter ebronensis TaxID=1462615 RepID=A0A4Q0YID4_9BACT|nr:OprD family outer membrane porin [Halarcobacter ebronensis]RXJ69544.1 porin [Halarcobacter ebronensis]